MDINSIRLQEVLLPQVDRLRLVGKRDEVTIFCTHNELWREEKQWIVEETSQVMPTLYIRGWRERRADDTPLAGARPPLGHRWT